MIMFFLFVLIVCSFLFYGVVGADKIGLEGPGFLFNFLLVTAWMLKKAWGVGRRAVGSLQTINLQLPTAGALFLLFLIWGIAMLQYATVPFESKRSLLMIGGVVGAYFVWGGELRAFKKSRTVLGGLIFVVMLTALYGLVVHFKCPDQVLWTERYAVYEGRLMSTYICPNHFAHLMQMLLPFCLVLLFIPQSGLYLKILSAYSFLVFLPPMFLTESRAGWLGSIAAVGVTLCLMALRRSKKLFAFLVVLIPLCSILLLVGAWHSSETFQRRMQPVVTFIEGQAEEGVGSESRDFRPQTWMDTIDMIKEAPLFGHGPGNYRYTFPEYRKRFKGHRIVTGHPHNEYLELIADYGLIGFGLFALAWLYGCIWVLIKSLKAKETRHAYLGFAFLGVAAGTMVHSFFDFQMHIYPNALVFALLAATAIGPLAAKRAKGVGRRALGNRGEGKKGGGEKGGGEKGVGRWALGVGEDEKKGVGRLALGVGGDEKRGVGGRKAEDGRDKGKEDIGLQAVGRRGAGERAEVRNQKPNAKSQMPMPLLYFVLAIAYLVASAFCVQTMSSAYIRALGDKAVKEKAGIRHQVVGVGEKTGSRQSAVGFYQLAIKIDPQNWRAYKGLAQLFQEERYYTIDLVEKCEFAEIEREWWEKAYLYNPKDPEILSGLGKSLIFQGTRQQALGIRASVGGEGKKGVGRLALGVGEQKSHALSPAPSAKHLTPSALLIERGLDLLRDACRYRKFNDTYWWTLGMELRKAGQYEEALETFKYARKLKNTPSIRKNIAWLEAKLKAMGKVGVGR